MAVKLFILITMMTLEWTPFVGLGRRGSTTIRHVSQANKEFLVPCGQAGWWHWWQNLAPIYTGPRFQVARSLLVMLGVFHA